MFSNNPTQDAEVKEYFRRAERNPDRRGPLRKEAFKRLLGFAHTEDALHKKLVTEKVKEYFVDFPDLQDEAINAVYDLCEDQDQEIRIAGYSAITSVSRVDRNWLLRNADVLVQLLQSDDDKEVTVVKRALQEHVDLDARRTLQVLSDQCVYDAADLADEDERALRARLRSLVLQFLVEKYRVCVARVVRESDVEDILLKGMTGAIPQATHSEARTIVKEILINLPSLSNGPTSKGNSVLEVLLDATRSTLDAELSCASSESSAELEKTTFLLSLAEFLTSPASPASRPIPTGPAASRALSLQTSSRPSPPADPLRLLQFFVKLFTPNKGPFAGDVLEKRVSGEAGFKVIDYLCKAVEVATLLGSKNPGDLDSVKTHFVNVSPVLFGVLNKYISASPTPALERTTLRSRLAILRIIKERVLDSRDGYSPPPLLASALGTLQASLSSVPKESEPSVSMDEDTRTGEPGRPSTNEIEEAMETIRNLLKAFESRTIGSNVTTSTRARGQNGPPGSGKSRFEQRQRRSPAAAPGSSLASRLAYPSTTNAHSNGTQDIALRSASVLTRTRSDVMDVDEEEHGVMGGAPPSDIDGTYGDASPRMRKKPRRKSVTASDAPQSTSRGGAAMPTLLSRLNSSSPAPISNAPSMKQTTTARKAQSGIGSPGMSINTRFSGGPIGVNGLGSAGDTSGIGSSSTVRTSANNSLFSRVHSASAGVGSDNAIYTSALKASHPTTGGIMTTKGSAPGRKHGASKWREPLDASLPDDGMGLSILGASNIDADEIKIRGAAQRRGEDTGHAHGPGGGGSSLLARMGDSGEGGAPGKGDHSGDRKRKIRVG